MDADRRTAGFALSIRAKLLLASAAVLASSTLVYGWVAYTTARDALMPSIREQLADDATNVKGGLEEMLTAHRRSVLNWTRLPLMRELVVRDLDKTVARFLQSVKEDLGVYLEVLVLDREGICTASSEPADIGRPFAGTALAGSAGGPGHAAPGTAANGEGAASSPTLEWSDERKAWYIRLAASIPAPDGDGPPLGTLVAMLDREVLDHIVVPKPGHSHIELRLVDGQGRLVAGSEEPLQIRRVEAWRVGHAHNPDHYPVDSPPILQEGLSTSGEDLILAQVPIGNREWLPTPGWKLTASVPKGIALAPVAAVRDRVATTGLALLVTGLLVAWLLAGRLTRPIHELTEVAVRIASTGDLEDVPEPRSRDEVGELARAFQSMVRAVRNASDELVRRSKLAFLGEMAAGMAHEVRTPLGIIRNAAQLLERRMDSTKDAEGAKWAVFIREESDRLGKVVTELLEFVKPVPPSKTDEDLDALARRSIEMLAGEASGRGVTLEVEGQPSPVLVPCDPDQMRQVVLNLAMNALQASERGGAVRLQVARAGDHVEMVVRDRGRGIPAGLDTKLFEPFTSERDGGIGLGLAIVRRIVRAHGGEVTARNRVGGGAKFVVTLPAAAAGPMENP